jgi:hypothetical protein
VLVIFLFLRSPRATLIPSLAMPLSIVGSFAVMHLLGYSLDNLSLLALTLAWASWSTTPSSCSRTSCATCEQGRRRCRPRSTGRARSASRSCR